MRVIFGGSFDPVHIGHLRMATELAEYLELPRVDLMPCAVPVHKRALGAGAADRLAMLELSIENNPRLGIDCRELERSEPSYSIGSLRAVREQTDEPLVLAMGSDSAAGLAAWREAECFADLCHLVVIERPDAAGRSAHWQDVVRRLRFHEVSDRAALSQAPAGLYLPLTLNLLDISSTFIRNAVTQNRSIRYLVTDAVERYICDNGLYKANLGGSPR